MNPDDVDAEDVCPDCGREFPVLYGSHPTWVPCGNPRPWLLP